MPGGRPPKSIEAHRRDGTLNVTRHSRTATLIGGRSRPEPSDDLTENQKERFHIIVDDLWDAGILDRADRMVIELAAVMSDTIAQCNHEIERSGLVCKVIIDDQIYQGKQNPHVPIRERSITQARQLYDVLGIGPSARARLANMGVKGRNPSAEIVGLDAMREARAKAVGGE